MSEGSTPFRPAPSAPVVPHAGSAQGRERSIERIVERLGSLAELGQHHAMPGWLGQDRSMGQMRLLFLLEAEGPVPMSRIAEKLGTGMPAASGIVDRVERHGLVARIHRADDRRVVECRLTDAGRDLVAEVSGRRNAYTRQVLVLLTDDELEQLDRILSAVVERMTADAPT